MNGKNDNIKVEKYCITKLVRLRRDANAKSVLVANEDEGEYYNSDGTIKEKAILSKGKKIKYE